MSEPANSEGEPRRAITLRSAQNWRNSFARTMHVDRVRDVEPTMKIVGVGLGIAIIGLLFTKISEWVAISGFSIGFAIVLLCSFRLIALGIRHWLATTHPFKAFCPYCGKYVASDVEWRCGFCGKKNTETQRFSFLNKCQHCHAAPKGYVCHNCSQLIVLGSDFNDKNFRTNATIFTERPPEKAKPIAALRKERLEEIDFQVTLTRMNTELAQAKTDWLAAESRNKEGSRSSGSKVEQSFKAHWNRNLEVHTVAEKNLEKAKREYADNPKMAEQAEIVIKDWVAQELGKVE